MLPYTLIVASASRPHLLRATLTTLLAAVDQAPFAIIVHDDAAFPGKQEEVQQIVAMAAPVVPTLLLKNDPPILHGPTLNVLLEQVQTEYALYTQDDHIVVRPLPIREALAVMHEHHLHHIRFNKRDTMPYKETWQGRWYKVPLQFALHRECVHGVGLCTGSCDTPVTLTVSDHWHFQTSLWRVAQIRPVLRWFMDDLWEGCWFHEHCETKINTAFNGGVLRFPRDLVELPPIDMAPGDRERDQLTRAKYQRTFIFGKIDEKAFIQHIGNKPEDWALPHAREPYDGR